MFIETLEPLTKNNAFGDNYNPFVRHRKTLSICFLIVAYLSARWDFDMFVDNGTANTAVSTDFNIIK
jgi:hypothetical protein